jgi:hypothetical protein
VFSSRFRSPVQCARSRGGAGRRELRWFLVSRFLVSSGYAACCDSWQDKLERAFLTSPGTRRRRRGSAGQKRQVLQTGGSYEGTGNWNRWRRKPQADRKPFRLSLSIAAADNPAVKALPIDNPHQNPCRKARSRVPPNPTTAPRSSLYPMLRWILAWRWDSDNGSRFATAPSRNVSSRSAISIKGCGPSYDVSYHRHKPGSESARSAWCAHKHASAEERGMARRDAFFHVGSGRFASRRHAGRCSAQTDSERRQLGELLAGTITANDRAFGRARRAPVPDPTDSRDGLCVRRVLGVPTRA